MEIHDKLTQELKKDKRGCERRCLQGEENEVAGGV